MATTDLSTYLNFKILKQYFTSEVANVIAGGTCTINWNSGNKQKLTNDANSTLTFTAPPGPAALQLRIVHAANSTTYTVTWPTIKWSNGTAPTLTQTSGSIDIISLYYDGTSYHGAANTAFA